MYVLAVFVISHTVFSVTMEAKEKKEIKSGKRYCAANGCTNYYDKSRVTLFAFRRMEKGKFFSF